MKMFKVAAMAGIFFFFMQFSTVILFNQMLVTSKKHNLSPDLLIKYQAIIMNIIIFSFIIMGILFMALIIAMVRNTWKQQPKGLES